jgi:hypothetical protein
MAKIKKEWLEAGSVDQNTIALTAKLDDNDTSAPTMDIHLANKKYVDDSISGITLPSVFELQGNWDGSTNTPTLANTDTGVDGYLYYVNVAGSVDFGAGSKSFDVGDWVYNVNGAWEKADNNDDVLSVNGQKGAVVLDSDDIAEGVSNLYYTEARFDSSLSGKDTGDLAEGSNLYFTDARAKTAAVVNSTAGSETDQAPSVAAMKAYADGAGVSTIVEEFTLDGTDISNMYVTLSNTPIAGTISASPVGGPPQSPSADFSVVGSQFNFLGDLLAELGSGDKLLVSYSY